jgi:hypothetical protein
VVLRERDVLAGDVVSVGVLGDVNLKSCGLDHAVEAHRALAEVHKAVCSEDGSAGFVPAALRQLVYQDLALAGFEVVPDDARLVAALEADVEVAVLGDHPPRAAEALRSDPGSTNELRVLRVMEDPNSTDEVSPDELRLLSKRDR